MKTQVTIFLMSAIVLLTGSASAQGPMYRLKSTGQNITKAQVDSIAKANNNKVQYNMQMIDGRQVIEIGIPSSAAGDTARKMSSTFSQGASGGSTQTAPVFRSKTYKDENGNAMSADAFKTKVKSGDFSYTYSIEKTKDGSDVTYSLVPKKQAEDNANSANVNLTTKLIGSKLPDFEFETMDGGKVSLSSLAGKVIVLNFWFVTCGPCIAEMPMLNEVVRQYKSNSNVVFLAMSFDKRDAVKGFLAKTSFGYRAIPETMKYNNQLGIYAYPTQIVVNGRGVIDNVIIGGHPEDTHKALVESINKSLN